MPFNGCLSDGRIAATKRTHISHKQLTESETNQWRCPRLAGEACHCQERKRDEAHRMTGCWAHALEIAFVIPRFVGLTTTGPCALRSETAKRSLEKSCEVMSQYFSFLSCWLRQRLRMHGYFEQILQAPNRWKHTLR